jgi:hypothetical protein
VYSKIIVSLMQSNSICNERSSVNSIMSETNAVIYHFLFVTL